MLSFKKQLFFLLPLISFLGLVSFSLAQDEEKVIEVPLKPDIQNFRLDFPYVKSSIYHITGSMDLSKKFLLISSFYESSDPNSKGPSPNFFISKNDKFDKEEDQYDYTSIEPFNNKIAISKDYFSEKDINGFFLFVTCPGDGCHNLYANFAFVNEIDLKIGERFSYLFSDKTTDKVNDITLNVKNENEFSTLGESVAFFLMGGNEAQVSMEIDGNFVTTKFTNVFYYTKRNVGLESSQVVISLLKPNERNVKVTFKTETYFDSEHSNEHPETDRKLYEGAFDEFFTINENINECFTVEPNGENTDSKMHELFIVSQKKITAQIIDLDNKSTILELTSINPFNNFGFENLLPILVQKICLTTDKGVKQALVSINIRRRAEDESYEKPVRNSNPLFDQTLYVSNRPPTNMVSVYSHDHFFSHSVDVKDFIGMNMGINVINGKLKVYKTICKNYPYCTYSLADIKTLESTEKYDSDFQTIVPINNYYSISFSAYDDFYSLSNKQNVILVTCTPEDNPKDDINCLYTVNFYPTSDNKYLKGGDKITKFLPKYDKSKTGDYKIEDSYSVALHQEKKIVIDLIVYSGDCFIVPSILPEKCYLDEHHLGSNERRILHCDKDFEIAEYIRYNFKVRANNEGAVYNIYVSEKDQDNLDDMIPMEMTTMESIHGDRRSLLIDGGKYFSLFESEENAIFLTLFNTINCDLKVINQNNGNEYLSTENNGFVVDATSTKELSSDNVRFTIQKTDSTHADEKNCLYYVASNYLLNKDSFMFIPEAKPFRFKLSKNYKTIRTSFLFSPVDLSPRVYLRVGLFNETPIKLIIKVGYEKEKEYILFQSKDILIVDGRITGLKMNTMNQIKIIAQLLNENADNEEAIVDLNVKTKNKIPYSIKSEEYFSDIVNKNNTQYYISMMSYGSRGDVLVNFKFGTGVIYGKLYNYKDPKTMDGWNNRVRLPDEHTKDLLKFDYYEQKLTITREDTEYCDEYCYLIFGVKTKDEYSFSEEFTSAYSLYFRYANMDEFGSFFVFLPNNEFITSTIKNEQNDYFKYIYYTEHDFTLIDFKSDYCSLSIGVNTPNFENADRVITYDGTGANQIIKISKQEILSKAGKNPDTDQAYSNIKGIVLYIKIARRFADNEKLSSIDIDKLDMKYKLRINSPNKIMENIVNIDTSHPMYCNHLSSETVNGKEMYYCDYLMKLDAYDYFSNIEIVGISQGHDELKVYCNIINSNDFSKAITQEGKLPTWPTTTNYQFPAKEKTAQNFLKLTFFDFPTEDDKSVDPRLLIRVYSSGKSNIELFTSMVAPSEEVVPFSQEYQLFSADDKKGVKIKIPNDHSYNIHIITIMGEGELMLSNNEGVVYVNNGKNFSLYGDYSSLIVNTKENEEMYFTIRSVVDTQRQKEKEQGKIDDTNFRFYLWYTKNIYANNMEKISQGSSANFITRKKDTPPLSYFLKLPTSVEEVKDLPFEVDLKSLLSYTGTQIDTRDSDVTELFYIQGFLLTEEELINLQTGNAFDKLFIDGVTQFIGNYDYTLHQASVFIPGEKIKDFITKNVEKSKGYYAYINLEKRSINRREYYYLNGAISSFSGNDFKRSTPSKTYLTNYFIKGQKKHIYKLDGLSSTDEAYNKMKVEFASKNNNIKVKFVKSPEETNDQSQYFESKKISETNKIGKDVYIINKHLNEVYLLIECNEEIEDKIGLDITKIPYTFKYSAVEKGDVEFKFKEVISYKRFADSTNKIKLTVDKVKYTKNSKNVLANYYIRIFEKEETEMKKLNQNSVSFRLDRTYSINKIKFDDELLSGEKTKNEPNFNIEIFYNGKKNFYIDVVAEIADRENEGEFLGYQNFYPEITKKEDNSGRKFTNNTVYVVIGISGILVIISIVLVGINILYRNKNKDLEKRVEEISFKISRGDSIDDGKIDGKGDTEENLLN